MSDAPRFRYGFWAEADGSEGFTCGWGYTPMENDSFLCVSYRDDYEINEKREKYTYSNFTNIDISRHTDFNWSVY